MRIVYRKRFLKELSKIPTEIRSSIESFVFKELPEANTIFESINSQNTYPSHWVQAYPIFKISLFNSL